MDWMAWVYYVALLALLICGLGVQLMGLPGLWLMAASALAYAWWTGLQYLGYPGLITIFALALLGEVLEFLAGAGGAKSAGGSKRSMVFGTVGGIVGGIVLSIPLWIVGTILGVCIGAFAGAALAQMTVEQDMEHSARVGLGAAKGTFIGILYKLTVGCVMFVVTAVVAVPLGGAGRTAGTTTAPSPTTAPAALPSPATVPAPATGPATQPAPLPAGDRE